jgi:sugar/nucleoside kinase (ribokinase family)
VLKLGAQGCQVRQQGQTWHLPGLPAQALDATGAGTVRQPVGPLLRG